MSETLLEKLSRLEKDVTEVKSRKTIKPIDYSEGISILESINKELTKKLTDLNAKYYELNKELLVIKNKKPVVQVDYSEQINALDKRMRILVVEREKDKDIKLVSVGDFKVKCNSYDEANNEINKTLDLIANKKEVRQIDHSKELLLISNEISTIKQKINKKQEYDIKSEVEKVVNIAYINNLYRNK